jgi:acetyltransferase-like isoleucine patch superfamily enzyme
MRLHGVTYGKGFYCCGPIFFRKAANANMVLGNYVSINSHGIADPIGGDTKTMLIVDNNATLILHDNVSISNATIFASTSIEIGEHTCIGGGVKIYDTDFHSIQVDKRLNGNRDVPCKPIHIGKRVFIGGHSIILKGIFIGDEAVIGAGSVVTKNVPAGEIWAGNPAKFIKKV